MSSEESQEFIQIGHQLKSGPEAELFTRYEYLVGKLLSAMRTDSIEEGINRMIGFMAS